MIKPVEPQELARQLGVSAKSLRSWLRDNHPRSEAEHGQRWHLTPPQVAAATSHFRGRRQRSIDERSQDSLLVPAEHAHDDSRDRRTTAAAAFRPTQIRLLLVAEAPPRALDRYFYFDRVAERDSLFRYVIRGLFGATPPRTDKHAWLTRLREEGVFLIDVSEVPEGASNLTAHLPDLVDRCRRLRPEHIILIKATVYDTAYQALSAAGLPVVKCRIPFPGSGQQARFEAEFSGALAEVGWSLA
jgi:hypothetical protein